MGGDCCKNISNLSLQNSFRHFDYHIGIASVYNCRECKDELLYDNFKKMILGKTCNSCKGLGRLKTDKKYTGFTFMYEDKGPLLRKCDKCGGRGISEEKIFNIDLTTRHY